jgi:hypothetical protein
VTDPGQQLPPSSSERVWRVVLEVKRYLTAEQARNFLAENRDKSVYAVNDQGQFIENWDGPITTGRLTPDLNALNRSD